METLTGLRVALNSWAAIPKDKVIGRSITGARQDKVTDGVGWGLGQEEGNLDPSFDGEDIVLGSSLNRSISIATY